MIPPVLGKLAIVMATSLSGRRLNATAPAEPTCASDPLQFCSTSSHVTQSQIVPVWALTLLHLMFMLMPTLFVPSRDRERGLRLQLPPFLICLSCLLFCIYYLHSGLASYIVSLNTCMYVLLYPQYDPSFVGGHFWWSLRYVAALEILWFIVYEGPPAPIVRWPGVDNNTAQCAALAHFIGAVLPDAFRCFFDFFMNCMWCAD